MATIQLERKLKSKVFIDTLFLHKNPNLDPCWLWIGHRQKDGYGVIKVGNEALLAHRVSYELFKGELLHNLEIDHLCRIRCCVNPLHLEQVTHAVNMSRSPTQYLTRVTHCPKGHEYNLVNSRLYQGYFICRLCDRERRK